MRCLTWTVGLFGYTNAMAETPAPVSAVVRHYTTTTPAVAGSGTASVWQLAGQAEGAKNAFFGVLELQPGAQVPVHRDATEEYLYVLNGEGDITIDGTTTAIKAGFGVFMPAGAEVSFVVTGEEAVRVVQFFAGPGPEKKYDEWTTAKSDVKSE